MNFRSITTRIVVMLGTLTVILLGAEALVMDHLVDVQMQQRFDASLLLQARAMAGLVENGPHGLDMEELQREPTHLLLGNARSAYMVRCDNGTQLQSQPAPSGQPEAWYRQGTDTPSFADIRVGGVLERAVWFRFVPGPVDASGSGIDPAPAGACHFLLMQPRRQLDNILHVIDWILLITPTLALLGVLVGSPILVRRGLRPLVTLGEHMRNIGPHAPGTRLAPGSTHELQPLTARFNEVLERMDEGMARERRFAGALAHETRTGLAELRALVDVERRYPSGRSLHEILDDISEIGGELENTVAGLLLMTRLDAGLEHVERNRVEVRPLVEQLLERNRETVLRRQLSMRVTTPEVPLELMTDPSLLAIVLGNLLRNAAAYAPVGESVEVAWDGGVFRVANHAPELQQEDVEQMGQRHWRKHQRDGEEHAGLGLSLAAAAAATLGFKLRFELDERRYLCAVLDWSSALDA